MREHPMGWPRALHPRRSPCRIDRDKGIHQHRCSSAHRDLVDGYRSYRDAEYAAAEAASGGYATELADYWQQHQRPTFRAYLVGVGRDADDDTRS